MSTLRLRFGSSENLVPTTMPGLLTFAVEVARCRRVFVGDRLAGHPITWLLPRKKLLLYVPDHFYSKKLIFIHIPKNAGTSISMALYGESHDHRPAYFYQKIDPEFFRSTPSFAVVRNPYERTLSSYCFLKRNGGSHVPLSAYWHHRAQHVGSFDDYLIWLEDLFDRGAMLDFTMRRQSEFVCDDRGDIIVNDIFPLQDDQTELLSFLSRFGVLEIPRLNITSRFDVSTTSRQRSMIEKIYEKDFALFETATRVSAG